MNEFLVELYVAKTERAALADALVRLADAIAELAAEGTPVRLARTIFVPEDETCFLLIDAPDAQVVRDCADRAALPLERIAEAAPEPIRSST